MFVADIRGKLSLREENSEDFLTSAVFSALNYLPSVYLKRFLDQARNSDGERLCIPDSSPYFDFWPYYQSIKGIDMGAEPDVVLRFPEEMVIVEAKFLSGKSGIGFDDETAEETDILKLRDQLARECLVGMQSIGGGVEIGTFYSKPKRFSLVYLTNDNNFPRKEIEETIESLDRMSVGQCSSNIYWLSWAHILPVLEDILQTRNETSFEYKISSELLEFLHRRGMSYFDGFKYLEEYHMDIDIPRVVFFRDKPKDLWTHQLFQNQILVPKDHLFFSAGEKELWRDFNIIIGEVPDTIFFEIGEVIE